MPEDEDSSPRHVHQSPVIDVLLHSKSRRTCGARDGAVSAQDDRAPRTAYSIGLGMPQRTGHRWWRGIDRQRVAYNAGCSPSGTMRRLRFAPHTQNMPPDSIDSLLCAPSPSGVRVIPVLRPHLPTAERLLPYLRRIDGTRFYTNWGPLCSELEQTALPRTSDPAGRVVSASSGSAALIGAILASAGSAGADRPVAILPAFTFIATASAVEQCGYSALPGRRAR